ncbi:SMI1/KNR4 family protein [Campylobacter concisus]
MKIIETIKGLKNMRSLGRASEAQILQAENLIGIKFADEFKEYIKEYGAVSAYGLELLGVSKSKRLDAASVTLEERELNENFPNDMYVVENLGIDGVLILQNERGEVFEISPNAKPKKIYNSLADYLLNR